MTPPTDKHMKPEPYTNYNWIHGGENSIAPKLTFIVAVTGDEVVHEELGDVVFLFLSVDDV